MPYGHTALVNSVTAILFISIYGKITNSISCKLLIETDAAEQKVEKCSVRIGKQFKEYQMWKAPKVIKVSQTIVF